jgi:hypothetical protein
MNTFHAQILLSVIVIAGFGLLLAAWLVWPPGQQSAILASLTGAMAAAFGQVVAFWFQNSKSGNP